MNEQENRKDAGDIEPVETHEQTREVVPVGQMFPKFPTQAEWNTLNIIARTLKDGGVLPKGIDTVQKMVVVLQAGREIGLQPIEALNSLYFVNGKVAMYGEAVPNQIIRAGHFIEWGECNAETATVTITRGDTGKSMTTTFTMAQARERGYDRNEIYRKYPENMLKWRALSMTAKFLCPDALRGIGIKEEMEAEVIREGGKFEDKQEGSRVTGELKAGTYNKRPLDDALKGRGEAVPTVEGDEKVYPCDEDGCEFVAKTKAGLTKHKKAQHAK